MENALLLSAYFRKPEPSYLNFLLDFSEPKPSFVDF